jgi:hypothetical protein
MSVNLSFIGGAGWQFFDDNGLPLSGGKIYTYAAGTTTPLTTYTSRDGLTANANPIILDAAGRTPQQIWATEGLLYKYAVTKSNDVQIRVWDNIGGAVVASNLSEDLANTTDNSKGDALVGFRQANESGFLPGAVAKTVSTKLQDIISVRDFGAVGDGSTDDTAAIQAAIDVFKPTFVSGDGIPDKGRTIYVPMGTYIVTAPIKIYSGIVLKGDGVGSVLKAGPGLTTQILDISSVINDQARWIDISFLNFEGTGIVRAIKTSAVLFLNSYVHDCVFNIGYCIDLNPTITYTQSVSFVNNISIGPIEQFLNISGNRNLIENFNKEGTTGVLADPMINAKDCSELLIRNVLIEGQGSVNKVPFKFDNCSFTMQQIWFEITPTNGYSIEMYLSTGYIYNEIRYILTDIRKIKVANGSRLFVDRYNDDGGPGGLDTTLEIDATSSVVIDQYQGRFFSNLYRLDKLKSQLKINRAEISTGIPANGYLRVNAIKYLGGNQLINPSFEAGVYGWTFSGAPTSVTTENSEACLGLMMRTIWAAVGTRRLTQTFTIAASQIGLPFTFTGMVKIVAGDPNAWGSVVASGAGLVTASSDGFMSYAYAAGGWQIVSQTFTPLAAGTLTVGFGFFNVTEVLVDSASFSYGIDSEPDRTQFGSVELNNKTFTTGPAAPLAGTWKVGDRVFNSSPAIGQPKSWVCTVAGTPGTWLSEGNL